jgi:hypothetical protein
MVVGERLPEPVVVPVDVDGEQVELRGDLALAEEVRQRLGSQEGVLQAKSLLAQRNGKGLLDALDGLLAAFEPLPGPPIQQQRHGIVLNARADAKLDEEAVRRPDAPEDLGDDAVFLVLGEGAAAVSGQVAWVLVARLLAEELSPRRVAIEDAEAAELALEIAEGAIRFAELADWF